MYTCMPSVLGMCNVQHGCIDNPTQVHNLCVCVCVQDPLSGEVLGLMTYDRPIAYGEMTETYSKANAAMHDRCLSENIIIKQLRFDSGSEHCQANVLFAHQS